MTEHHIQQALTKYFERHRIVFWYDDNQEFKDVFEALEMEGVEKIEINANEFSVKYRVLRESPKQNFLLYREGPEPQYLNNWLLDVQLSHNVFRTDQSAIWLSELELPPEFADVVTAHAPFFEAGRAPKQAEVRKERLRALIQPDDLKQHVRLKMLAVCADLHHTADVRLDIICESLLEELTEETQPRFTLIERCNLAGVFWALIERHYGYVTETPSIKDLSIELFKSCFALSVASPKLNDKAVLGNDALVFFKRWKDSRKHGRIFESLSEQYAELLNVKSDLVDRDLKDVVELDFYRRIDEKIIIDLVASVEQRTLSDGEVTKICRERRQSHWYKDYRYPYEAIELASQFLAKLETTQLDVASSSDALQNYVRHWFRLDQIYRKFIFAFKKSPNATSLLSQLNDKIESLYTNRFLNPLATQWQGQVDSMSSWSVPDSLPQRHFFQRWVKPYLDKGQKICVIISDAFRYEAADEMVGRINRENKFQSTLDHMLSSLPSYTQLGMASLLPGADGELEISNSDSSVSLNGSSTQGTVNRDKLIKSVVGDKGCAVQAKDLSEMTTADGKELFRDHELIYVYHNRIDHAGDKMQSEGEAFEATERTFDDLLVLIKRLANYFSSNVLITADHGFVYQNRPLEESDFLAVEASGDPHYRDRRFLLGKKLSAPDSMKIFSAEGLGLSGDVHAAIPKGIQRLRLKGSGSRFVHGGATLQEVVVPVISVNKKRSDDVSTVEVDLIRSGSNLITSGQLSVTVYQTQPVTDKLKMRELRAGIYKSSGQLISDQHTVIADLEADSAREREQKLRFVLTQESDNANNQEVYLKLEEPVDGTNQYKEYKQLVYTIRRSFSTDFDF